MSMSKSDFREMAAVLHCVKPIYPRDANTREHEYWEIEIKIWNECVCAVSDACARQYKGSYGFEPLQFKTACEDGL